MSKRMLIDGAHSEEIRVVVTSGNRLDEYDIETSFKKQIKGNIYLAKVTRVEPSLQAAFVDFGGNRHGFLAFSEIHPDYYQIPMEDRKALIEEQEAFEMRARAAREHLEDIEGGLDEEAEPARDASEDDDLEAEGEIEGEIEAEMGAEGEDAHDAEHDVDRATGDEPPPPSGEAEVWADADDDVDPPVVGANGAGGEPPAAETLLAEPEAVADEIDPDREADDDPEDDAPAGGGRREAAEGARPRRSRGLRRYKIQEVIKRRQILLVQVVKEERGNKGAALTTYISLAGRYCVLMPNSSRGGGISRKITSAKERRKLRDTLNSLDMPEGMGVIIRTAGLERSKAEIKRDFEYLVRAWDEVRELTLQSTAPQLVHEEGDIIKRAIRDLYAKEIDEILIEGNDTYQTAKKFMRLMMPSHAKRVQPYRDETIPLFHRFQIEQQLDAMHNPEVQLKSGGYIVLNPTEALVAIDVNSGKSTRERNIEETALKTNLEAADEVARQLRLRDLAGLIVIDFIDMEESRHVRQVERRLREAMKTDRARLQIGRISNFGLLELSRQRLRPSLIETSSQICAHCHGTGHVLSTESMSMRVLRAIEEEGIRMRSSEITVSVPTAVALYILNQKRSTLVDIETRYGFRVSVEGDDSVIPPDIGIERVKGRPQPAAEVEAIAIEIAEAGEDEVEEEAERAAKEESPRRGRRRRGRRRGRDEAHEEAREEIEAASDEPEAAAAAEPVPGDGEPEESAISADAAERTERPDDEDGAPRRRRRGRRGGRRRRAVAEKGAEGAETDAGQQPEAEAGVAAAQAAEEPAGPVPAAHPAERAAPVGEVTVAEVAAALQPMPEEPAEEDAATEEAAEPDVVIETLAETQAPEPVHGNGTATDGNGADNEPAEIDYAGAVASTGQAAAEQPEEEANVTPGPAADRPKRRGWWQRIVE